MSRPIPQLPGVEHHHVQVGALRLHYAEAGSGEPLILQHGWPQHWWLWRKLIDPLSQRFRVICPDLRGHGWSQAPASGYRKDELAADMIGLMDALGIERARLIGHDWGGYVGFLVCLGHPDRISHFMPLSIAHLWPPSGPPDLKLLARGSYQLVLAAPLLGKLSMSRLGFARTLLRAARSDGTYTDAELATYNDVLASPAGAQASMQMYRTFLRHELVPLASGAYRNRRLHTPTRLLMGERDPIRRSAGPGFEPYADDMSVEIVPGAGHFLPEERPDVVLERALEFLA